jgi:hypothetical protein
LFQVGVEEVRVAADAELGKMDERRVATVPVHGVDQQPGHGEPDAPVVWPAISVGSVGMLSPK